jgi:lactoylglutathione lyase
MQRNLHLYFLIHGMQKEFLGLRTAIYKVPDLEKAKQWYTKVFETTPYFDMPFYIGFNIGGYELGLQPDEKNEARSENIEIYWGVDNVETSYNRLIELGATAHQPPQNVGEEIIVATVKDPWKNIIGIIYNPGFKAA